MISHALIIFHNVITSRHPVAACNAVEGKTKVAVGPKNNLSMIRVCLTGFFLPNAMNLLFNYNVCSNFGLSQKEPQSERPEQLTFPEYFSCLNQGIVLTGCR